MAGGGGELDEHYASNPSATERPGVGRLQRNFHLGEDLFQYLLFLGLIHSAGFEGFHHLNAVGEDGHYHVFDVVGHHVIAILDVCPGLRRTP